MAQQVLQLPGSVAGHPHMVAGVNQLQVLERLRQLRSWQERQQQKLLQQQQQELIALRSAQTAVVQTHEEEEEEEEEDGVCMCVCV